MSINKLKEDLSYGTNKEAIIRTRLEKNGFEVIQGSNTDIIDFEIRKDGIQYLLELKSRRCEKDKYETTLIGANKLGEAFNRYYKDGVKTLFIFQFTDGVYFIDPFRTAPTTEEYKKFRWDRGGIDKPKGWLLYNINDLSKL